MSANFLLLISWSEPGHAAAGLPQKSDANATEQATGHHKKKQAYPAIEKF
jgi:hypothetical protein